MFCISAHWRLALTSLIQADQSTHDPKTLAERTVAQLKQRNGEKQTISGFTTTRVRATTTDVHVTSDPSDDHISSEMSDEVQGPLAGKGSADNRETSSVREKVDGPLGRDAS